MNNLLAIPAVSFLKLANFGSAVLSYNCCFHLILLRRNAATTII
jgi:hypothetical protein